MGKSAVGGGQWAVGGRSHGDGQTTPEGLLAASHGVCYAMVLTHTIGKQGGTAGPYASKESTAPT